MCAAPTEVIICEQIIHCKTNLYKREERARERASEREREIERARKRERDGERRR